MIDWWKSRLEVKRERQAAERIAEWAKRKRLAPFRISERKPKQAACIPFHLGNVTVDLQPAPTETLHVAIGGSSRQGKSSAAMGLLELPVGVLVISLDNTRPIASMVRQLSNGIEWSNEEGWPVRWDMLRGAPRLVAEGLTASMPKSDHESGHYRDIARLRIASRLAQADRDGEVRSLPMLIEALIQRTDSPDPMVDRAARHWATKLANLYEILGDSVGRELDLLDAMQAQKKVLMRLNRYLNPEVAPMLGGMLLIHARRVAQESRLPFILIIEEAGQLDEHDEQIKPLAQAAADRRVPMVIVTQNLSKLPVEVTNNIAIWVSFSQEAKRELDFASHFLSLSPVQLRREAFPGKDEQQGRGWCYVRGPGMLPHLVKVKPPLLIPTIVEPELPPIRSNRDWELETLPAIDGWHPEIRLSLPGPRTVVYEERLPEWVGFDSHMLRMWKQMNAVSQPTPLWSPTRGVFWSDDSDEHACLQWTGPLSKRIGDPTLGRPRSNVGRKSVTVYVETKRAWVRLKGLKEKDELEPTLDHMCDLPTCCEPTHTYACSIQENNANRKVREVLLRKAWMERYGQVPSWWINRHTERIAA